MWCLWQRKDFSTCPGDRRTEQGVGLTPHFHCTLHQSVMKQIQRILLFPNLCHYTGRPVGFFSLNGSNAPQQPQTSRCPHLTTCLMCHSRASCASQGNAAACSCHWHPRLPSPSLPGAGVRPCAAWQPLVKLCHTFFLQLLSRGLWTGRSFTHWLRSCHSWLCWQWWKRQGFFRFHLSIKWWVSHQIFLVCASSWGYENWCDFPVTYGCERGISFYTPPVKNAMAVLELWLLDDVQNCILPVTGFLITDFIYIISFHLKRELERDVYSMLKAQKQCFQSRVFALTKTSSQGLVKLSNSPRAEMDHK